MRLEQIGDVSGDHFYVKTDQKITIEDFTTSIVLSYISYLGLPKPKEAPYKIKGRTSVIILNGILIEIESVGHELTKSGLEISDGFLLNTQDRMTRGQLTRFHSYLKHSMNGQSHQLHLQFLE